MMLNRFASIRPIGEDSRSASIVNRTARGAYMERPRILGDTHGQATMLWLCSELVDIAGRPTSD